MFPESSPNWSSSMVSSMTSATPAPDGSLGSSLGSRDGSVDRRSHRLQHILMAGEVSLALVAVFAGGLLSQSVRELERRERRATWCRGHRGSRAAGRRRGHPLRWLRIGRVRPGRAFPGTRSPRDRLSSARGRGPYGGPGYPRGAPPRSAPWSPCARTSSPTTTPSPTLPCRYYAARERSRAHPRSIPRVALRPP